MSGGGRGDVPWEQSGFHTKDKWRARSRGTRKPSRDRGAGPCAPQPSSGACGGGGRGRGAGGTAAAHPAGRSRAEASRTERSRTQSGPAERSRTQSGRAEPNTVGSSRAEPIPTEQSRTEVRRRATPPPVPVREGGSAPPRAPAETGDGSSRSPRCSATPLPCPGKPSRAGPGRGLSRGLAGPARRCDFLCFSPWQSPGTARVSSWPGRN